MALFGGVDPIAGLISLVALYIALREARLANEVALTIQECETSFIEQFFQFRIIVRNCGIPLHDVSLVLHFQEPSGHGRCNVHIPFAQGPRNVSGEFAKGMLAEFEMKSCALPPHAPNFLLMLKEPRRQHAVLSLYSQAYIAKTWRLGTRRESLKNKWNGIATMLNYRLARKVAFMKSRPPLLKIYNILPVFRVVVSPRLMWFLKSMEHQEPQVPTNAPAPTVIAAVASDDSPRLR